MSKSWIVYKRVLLTTVVEAETHDEAWEIARNLPAEEFEDEVLDMTIDPYL